MAKKPKEVETQEVETPVVDMSTLSWGDGDETVSAKIADIPATSLFALSQRGWTHVFGNECASSLTAEKKRRAEKGEPALTESEENAFLADKRAAKLAAIMNGTMGVRVGGARLSPLDRHMRDIARARLVTDATSKGIKLPSGKNTIMVRGKAMTLADLVAARIDRERDDIKAEAERRIAADSKPADIGSVDDLI